MLRWPVSRQESFKGVHAAALQLTGVLHHRSTVFLLLHDWNLANGTIFVGNLHPRARVTAQQHSPHAETAVLRMILRSTRNPRTRKHALLSATRAVDTSFSQRATDTARQFLAVLRTDVSRHSCTATGPPACARTWFEHLGTATGRRASSMLKVAMQRHECVQRGHRKTQTN